MTQSGFLATTCNLAQAREKWRVQGTIGFGFDFASQWLKNWRETFEAIIKRINFYRVITLNSHLKIAKQNALLAFKSAWGEWKVSL